MIEGAQPEATHYYRRSASPLFFWSLATFVLVSPLYYASILPLPQMLLQLGAIGFLFVIIVVQRAPWVLPRTLVAGLAVMIAYPLIQLLPLPDALWRALPGHHEYVAALDRFAAGIADQGRAGVRHTLSVVPAATEAGWLALLPPLACFLAATRLRADDVPKLLLLMTVFAGLEGLLGLLQVSASGPILQPRAQAATGIASGTFVNKNHFAGLLAMTLPVNIGLLVYSLRHQSHHRHHRSQARSFNANLFAQRALMFASAALMLLALLLSFSRAGIATAFIGLACTAVLLAHPRDATKHTRWMVLGVVGLGIALAAGIGITPILDRFDPDHLHVTTDERYLMSIATAHAAVEFLPFGSGLSTLVSVFPRFQPETMPGLVDYAHNDYAQAFLELGLAAPVIVALLLAAYGRRMLELLPRKGGHSFTILQLSAGIGLLPMILHSLFDFGLHMPAVAMWFATLAGVMFGEPDKPETGSSDGAR